MQVLSLGALINCVELKESANNCAAMASLVVRPLAAVGSRAGNDIGKSTSLSSQCFAPEFLAKLLVECTRSFAKHLEADAGEEGDGENQLACPANARTGGDCADRQGAEYARSSALTLVTPATREEGGAAMAPATAPSGGPGEGEAGEELMSPAEGAKLVLGGHCALLLGLLVREHETNRCDR